MKTKIYTRYPLLSIILYNGVTILHFLLGGTALVLGYSSWIGYLLGSIYLLFAFTEMYVLMPFKVCPNCPYYKLDNSLCISGLNVVSKCFVKEGNIKDQYYFEKKIGQGGYGAVYKAKNRLTKKNVAIKAVKKNQISDMNSFMREYKILSQLDHPNILNIREIWQWQEMLFIVTDFCEGGDLFAHMLDR